jgi:hypothetical protein
LQGDLVGRLCGEAEFRNQLWSERTLSQQQQQQKENGEQWLYARVCQLGSRT